MAISNKGSVWIWAGLEVSNLLLAAAARAQGVSFIARRELQDAFAPQSVAMGDFNGDGVPDLATANWGSNDVSVFLGNGDGSFQTARGFGADTSPSSVALGDFNGDGVPDLAVANNSSNDVSVLLGNGDGSFQPARNFGAGSGPNFVAVGNFNGDAVLDLIVANHSNSDVSVLLG